MSGRSAGPIIPIIRAVIVVRIDIMPLVFTSGRTVGAVLPCIHSIWVVIAALVRKLTQPLLNDLDLLLASPVVDVGALPLRREILRQVSDQSARCV